MRIALISDTHLAETAPAFDENLRIVRAWVAASEIDLTIHLGDVSADGMERPEQLDHARRLLANWPGALRVLPGNHDVGDNPGLHGHCFADPGRIGHYERLFGPDRWIVRAAAWTIVGVNAQLYGRGDLLEGAQAAWLTDALAATDGPLGLCLHKPMFRDAPDDGDAHHRYLPAAARRPLLDALTQKRLRFVASGHTHQTRCFRRNGVDHAWVPSMAFTLPDGMQKTIGVKEVGVTMLTLEGETHRFERVIPPGLVRHDLADHADLYPAHSAAIRAASDARG